MPSDALKHPRQGDRYRASKVVDRVGDDGHAVGEPSADEGDDGEGEVDEEGREDVLPRAITMQMDMIVCHNDYFIPFLVNNCAKVRIYGEFGKNNRIFKAYLEDTFVSLWLN